MALAAVTTSPVAAAIYCRISEDRTGQGLGVGRQEADCRAWAERHGWAVAEVYVDDDISAYSGKPRPAYRRLLAALDRRERDALVVWHPDRLHRSPAELEEFIAIVERTGVPIGTVTAGDVDLTSATGRMTARIVGAVARHESEHKSERILRKHLELAQNGRVSGGGRRPFGYEADRITVREDEAVMVREAARRVLAGEGLRSVARDWNARGVTTSAGGPWQSLTLKRILISGRICGWREHRGELVARGEWPAIIDEADGEQLRRLLNDADRRVSPIAAARSYLLSGLVVCGACGARMTAQPVVRKGHKYRRYACLSDRGGCNRVGIGAEPLEHLVVEQVTLALDTPELAAATMKADADLARAGGVDVAALEGRLLDLADDYADGRITRAEWQRMRTRLTDRITEAKAADTDAARSAVITSLVGIGVLRDRWPDLTFDQRRAIVDAVVAKVTIAATTKAGNRFDGDRAAIAWRSV